MSHMMMRSMAVLVWALFGVGAATQASCSDSQRAARVEIGGDTLDLANVPPEIIELLEQGRAWRAAQQLAERLRGAADPDPTLVFLAARAEAESGAWDRTREYLADRPWLDNLADGEGWFWLGRAWEAAHDTAAAVSAYGRYLSLDGGPEALSQGLVAELRLGLLLAKSGDPKASDQTLRKVREAIPGIGAWVTLVEAEARAARGDTAIAAAAAAELPATGGMRYRARLAEVQAFEAAGDAGGAMRRARAYQSDGGTSAERAAFAAVAGRLALAAGNSNAARGDLRAALELAPASAAARDAARLLSRLANLTPRERLALGSAYESSGNASQAAESFQAWLSSGAGASAQRTDVQLRLGRAYFNAGNFTRAEQTLRPLGQTDSRVAREALLLTGRSEYRRGARTQAFRTFETLADRFPGSVEGSEGLFLIADLSHDDRDLDTAARVYRRVADRFPGTDRAGLSLMRLAGMRYLAGDFAAAARVWEEYRSSYPTGERWLEASYWAGRAYEAAGDHAHAATLYAAVRARDPLSYYALRASEHQPTVSWSIPTTAAPPSNPAARDSIARAMAVVDLLRDAGLTTEADAEVQRLTDAASGNESVLYDLAERLNRGGYSIAGIRIGQQLYRSTSVPSDRLLRILFPFPYRPLIEAEAREVGLDPLLVAALIRQESLFTERISSPVGARGLMQIMPETGVVLARSLGVADWSAERLYNAEINVHLGARYLADQMKKYGGSLPSVFSAYNAGPQRIDDWLGFPERGDEELFTERIPYRETRDYVKILTRNIALYHALYATPTAGTDADDPAR